MRTFATIFRTFIKNRRRIDIANPERKRTMPKYLNSFIITDDIIKKMEEILKESRTKEIELGFSLCKIPDNNILKIGEQCVGGECSISLPERCEEKDDIYGSLSYTF